MKLSAEQRVTGASVDTNETICGKDVLDPVVAELHSHGSINAFFSSVDNRDEFRPCVYGVFGSYEKGRVDTSKHIIRVGEEGKFYPISISDFTYDDKPKAGATRVDTLNLFLENEYKIAVG